MIHKFKQKDTALVLDVNSGAVHVIDDMVYDILDFYPNPDKEEILAKLSATYESEDLTSAMEDIDYLIENEQLFSGDEYTENIDFEISNPVIKALCLHVAHDCNLRCKYCFASQGDFEGQRLMMDLETGKKAFDFIVANSGNRRNLEVDFFGGEPLMNFEVCKQLVDYGRSLEEKHNKHFRFTMTTNGVLLDDETIDYLNEHMDNIVLSLDGRKNVNDNMRPTTNGKGSYDVIVPNLKKMVEKRKDKQYYIRGTFTAENLDFSEDVIHFADLGFRQTSVEPVVTEPEHPYALKEEHMEKINEEYEKLAEEYIKRHKEGNPFGFFHFEVDLTQGPCVVKRLRGCGAGAEYVSITPEGDIYPCHQFVGNEKFKMGSVHGGEVNTEMATEFKNANVLSKDKCQTCWGKFYCSGGCHANAYNFNNDINIPFEEGCKMLLKRLECSLYIQAKLQLED
jgi:uncharacterized protein